MTAVALAIMGLHLLGMCATIGAVGKPRDPLTPGIAVATAITSLAVIVGTYWLWKL